MTHAELRDIGRAISIVFTMHMGAYYGLWLLGGLACRLGWVSAWCPVALP